MSNMNYIRNKPHPEDPHSNVPKFGGYDPNKYALDKVPLTVLTDEALTPGRAPCLTQRTIGKYLQPLTRHLVEVPPRPTMDELPEAVIDNMVQRDKAFWVDKPGANAYTLTDAYYKYEMTTEMVRPRPAVAHGFAFVVFNAHQDVFPRSYQYDVDCVKYRRIRACDGMNQLDDPEKKAVSSHCRDCRYYKTPGLTPFQLAWAKDPGQKRWRYYPDVSAALTDEEIRNGMDEVGRPFQHEACKWYNKNYPTVKYECILRKFSK